MKTGQTLSNRILVPISFSKTDQQSLRFADFLREFLGMELTLIHCYPVQQYSRPFNFGKKPYYEGAKEMLIKFYQEHVREEIGSTRFLTEAGALSETIAAVSHRYGMTLLGEDRFSSPLKRWMSSSASYIASMAKCPVLIVPSTVDLEKLPTPLWRRVWHINRKEIESTIIGKHIAKFKIAPDQLEVKSFKQTSFRSKLWESMVAYGKAPKKEVRNAIIAAREGEAVDLIMLVSHQRDTFKKFMDDEAIQIIFEFHIPILIFQAN